MVRVISSRPAKPIRPPRLPNTENIENVKHWAITASHSRMG